VPVLVRFNRWASSEGLSAYWAGVRDAVRSDAGDADAAKEETGA